MLLLSRKFNAQFCDRYTQKVKVPQGFEPSSPDKRGWLINPFGMERTFEPLYILGALAPALLLFILVGVSAVHFVYILKCLQEII